MYKQFDFDLAILHRFGTFLIAPVGATPIDRPPWDTAAFLFLVFLGLPFALRRQYRNVHAAALIVSVTLACFLGVLLMLPLVFPYKGLLSVPAFWLCIVAIYGLPAAPPQVVGWVVDPVVAKLSSPWRNVGLPVLRFSMGLALWPIAATHHLAAHRRQIVPWILAAIVASAVLLVWCVPALRSLPPTYPAGDQALMELYTLQATEGDLSVGAYSRKGWNHPGPAYFYALAPLYALTKHEFSLHWTVLLLNLISVAAAVALATRCGGWSLGLGLMAALSIYLFRDHPEPFSGFGHLLMSAWNPHTPVLPFAVLLLLCARLASGSLSVLPWVVLVASLVVQANVALVPCAAVVASTSMLLYAVRGRRSCSGKPSVFSVHSAIWMFALLWFLPLGEQLQGGADGNIAQIFNGFAAESQSNMAMKGYLPTPSTAFTVLSNALWTAVDFEAQVPMGAALPSPTEFHLPATIWTVLLLLLLGAGGLWAALTRQFFPAALCFVCLAAACAAFWSITRVSGQLRAYMFFWMSMIGVVGTAAILGLLLDWIRDVLSFHRVRVESIVGRMTVAGFTAALVIHAVSVLQHTHQLTLDGNGPRRHEREASRALFWEVERDLYLHRLHRPFVRIQRGRGGWAHAAAVALQLRKAGIPLAVEDSALFMFTDAFRATGGEDVELLFATVEPDVRAGDAPYRLVARHGSRFVYARELDVTFQPVVHSTLTGETGG